MADDHTLALQGLRELLKNDYQIVGEVHDGSEVVPAARQLHPDIVLLDISMSRVNGFEAAAQIKTTLPGVRIIFVTMHTEPTIIMEAFQVGASGYVLKHSAASELIYAIQTVLRHEWFLSSQIGGDIREKLSIQIEGMPSDELSGRLTKRQEAVLQLIAQGQSSKHIAQRLNISLSTVAFHKTSIMQALGLKTSAELTKYAVRKGITKL